nr:claudin domain-containing protein 2 isoform X2 [Pongo abelii]
MSEGISDPHDSGHTAGPMARRPPLPPRAQLQLSLAGRGRHEPRPSTCGLVPDPLPVLVSAVTAGPDVTSKFPSKRLSPGRGSSAPGHTPGWGQETGELPVVAQPVATGAAPAGADAPALPSHAGGDCGVHGAGGGCRRGGHGDGTADSVPRGRVAAGPDHERLPLPRRLLLSAGRHDHAEHRRHQWIPRVSVTAACLGQNKGTAFLALRLRVLFWGSWGRRHGVAQRLREDIRT